MNPALTAPDVFMSVSVDNENLTFSFLFRNL